MVRRSPSASLPPSFTERLNADPQLAMAEGDAFFRGEGAVHETRRRITKRLDELGISYALAGGLALFTHGFRRYTEDVDLLVTAEGLKQVHEQLEGLGYIPPFAGSKNLRDTMSGVKIDFLVSGQFPGDGKPKPVKFPQPDEAAVEIAGVRCLNLPKIVELKLASGMTGSSRLKDLSDVQELIKMLSLPRDFAGQLNEYVRGKYIELWNGLRPAGTKYFKLWPKASPDKSTIENMRADGVQVAGESSDHLRLVTTDPSVAAKYDMHEESEFLDPQ